MGHTIEDVNLVGVHLVDRRPDRQFVSKPVESPEIIGRLGIDCVITVPPLSPWYTEIRAEAESYGVSHLIDFEQTRLKDFTV